MYIYCFTHTQTYVDIYIINPDYYIIHFLLKAVPAVYYICIYIYMSFGGMKHDYTAFKTIVLVLGIEIKSYMKKNLQIFSKLSR